jgi:hypothetical protein
MPLNTYPPYLLPAAYGSCLTGVSQVVITTNRS